MNSLPYTWKPGDGPSPQAIGRMRSHFPMPRKPMGEAWFMGKERRMYTELMEPRAVQKMDLIDLSGILAEIGSGTKCFGHLPEWDEWFTYLLPDLIERADEPLYFDTTLFQSVVSDFMAVFWTDIPEIYQGFRADVFSSLGRVVMSAIWWDLESSPRPVFLDVGVDGAGREKLFWGFDDTDPSFSAAMFFCLKYLPREDLSAWLDSVMAINNVLWQANVMIWFHTVYEFFEKGLMVPNDLNANGFERGASWDGSGTCLGSSHPDEPGFNDPRDFIPRESLSLCFKTMVDFYTVDRLLDLAHSFTRDEHVAMATYRVPESLSKKLRLNIV